MVLNRAGPCYYNSLDPAQEAPAARPAPTGNIGCYTNELLFIIVIVHDLVAQQHRTLVHLLPLYLASTDS